MGNGLQLCNQEIVIYYVIVIVIVTAMGRFFEKFMMVIFLVKFGFYPDTNFFLDLVSGSKNGFFRFFEW